MNIKDINPDAYRVVDQPLNINNLPQGSYAAVDDSKPVKAPFLQRAGSVIDAIFGGGKIGEAIGTEIARALATPEQRKQPALTAPGPSAGEIAGSALRAASLFTPVGRISGAIGGTLGKAGVTTGAKFLGNVGGITSAGYGFDVGSNLEAGKTGADVLKPGFGTATSVALPFIPPALKGATRLAAESVGVSTGAGYGAIKELFNASAKGGAEKKAALDALRGNTTPEQIVQEAKGALGQIRNSRAESYVRSLSALKDTKESYDISPVVSSVKTNLEKFGVTVGDDGALNFSRSPIRFNKQAQDDITTIVDTMKDYGSTKGDRTVVGLDSLKRALSDLYTPSGEARAFVTSVKSAVREVLSEAPGYDAMSADYETKSKLINEIQKTLSLGDKASIDTAFKKLTTVLRTNNEERRILVEELNAISGGTLVPKIAGQQMSEVLPRGIARQIEGFGALGTIMAGFGASLLKLAIFASPRIVGEMVNVLGLGAQAGNKLLDVLGVKGVKLISPGDRLLNTKAGQKLEGAVKQSLRNAPGLSMRDVTRYDDSGRPISNGDTLGGTGNSAKWPTTPSKKSTAGDTSTGNAATGKGGVSARKADTSVPFDGVPKELEPLAQEARKYKSAEEFVRAQGKPVYHQSISKVAFDTFEEGKKRPAYSQADQGIYFSPDKTFVRGKYGSAGGATIDAFLFPKKVLDLGEYDAMYFNGKKLNAGDIVVENFKRAQRGVEPMLPDPDILLDTITPKAKQWLKENGYDMVEGMKGEMHTAPEIVVINPSIIKTKKQLADFWKQANKTSP